MALGQDVKAFAPSGASWQAEAGSCMRLARPVFRYRGTVWGHKKGALLGPYFAEIIKD